MNDPIIYIYYNEQFIGRLLTASTVYSTTREREKNMMNSVASQYFCTCQQ